MITKDSPDWHDSPDAMVWAEKFVEILKRERAAGNPGADPEDPGFMVTWFANAMAAQERSLAGPFGTFPGHDASVTIGACRPNAPCPACRARLAA